MVNVCCRFVIADVPNAILDADFLTASQINFSCSNPRITVTGFLVPCKTCLYPTSLPVLALPTAPANIAELIGHFDCSLQFTQFNFSIQSNVHHAIDTDNSRLIFVPSCQLRPQLLADAKEEFRKLV